MEREGRGFIIQIENPALDVDVIWRLVIKCDASLVGGTPSDGWAKGEGNSLIMTRPRGASKHSSRGMPPSGEAGVGGAARLGAKESHGSGGESTFLLEKEQAARILPLSPATVPAERS